MKALALAAQQGQRIYTITPQVYANQPNIVNTALAAHSPSTRAKVQAALDEGKEVTIHEAPIAQSGWVGAGFTVIEEGTGAGAYTIEGGSNGGGLNGDFGQRYLSWVCNNMITNPYVLGAAMLLSPMLSVTKAFFGFSGTALGGNNPYTTLLRGLALSLGLLSMSAFAGILGNIVVGGVAVLPVLAVIVVLFVGFFNLTIMIEGLFYAMGKIENNLPKRFLADMCEA